MRYEKFLDFFQEITLPTIRIPYKCYCIVVNYIVQVHSQCQTLFEVNQQMITAMETHLQRFGFKPVPKLAKGFIKTVHPGSHGN